MMTEYEQLQQFLIQADELATARNVDEYVNLYVENGTIVTPEKTIVGQAPLRVFVQQTWAQEPVGALHLTVNPVVISLTPTTAQATTRLLIVDPIQRQLVTAVTVTHDLVKQAGRWQYQRRQIS